MSYCVNCGVELEASLDNCPLCECPVLNPMRPAVAANPHPTRLEETDHLSERRFVALLISVAAVFIALVCVAIGLVFSKEMGWVVIVLDSLGLAWLLCALPLLQRKPNAPRALVTGYLAVVLFLFVLWDTTGAGDWFIRLAVPMSSAIFLVLLLIVELIRRRHVSGLGVAAFVFLGGGGVVMVVEPCIKWYLIGCPSVEWAWFAMIPCIAVAAILFLLNRREDVKEAMAKRFHL